MKRAGFGAVRRASTAWLVLTAITAVGCGSGLSREQLRSANVPAFQSGPLGQLMLPYLQGAKAWVADVNSRGGLNGHPVRLINADDGGNPNQALALAKRMVEEDKVQAFYAIHAPTTLQAVTPYLEQKKVPACGT